MSNKGNNDGIEVKNNGNPNSLETNENNKEEFCEVDLDEVGVWLKIVSLNASHKWN